MSARASESAAAAVLGTAALVLLSTGAGDAAIATGGPLVLGTAGCNRGVTATGIGGCTTNGATGIFTGTGSTTAVAISTTRSTTVKVSGARRGPTCGCSMAAGSSIAPVTSRFMVMAPDSAAAREKLGPC